MRSRSATLRSQPALLRVVLFLLVLGLIWAPFALPIYGIGNQIDPNAASILALVVLYIEFLVLLWQWRRRVHRDRAPFQHCGLTYQAKDGVTLLQGLGLGSGSIALLFGIELLLGWAEVMGAASLNWRLLLEALAVSLGIGFAEEMLFRGWLLTELEEDSHPTAALWASSLIFAIAHFIRPLDVILATWPQFLGLLLLGFALVWAKRSQRGATLDPPSNSLFSSQTKSLPSNSLSSKSAPTQATKPTGRFPSRRRVSTGTGLSITGGRLSLPIGLHAGLVGGYYLINVGQLIEYTGRVPTWITGIDRNPLAGLLGLILLGLLASGLYVKMQRRQRRFKPDSEAR